MMVLIDVVSSRCPGEIDPGFGGCLESNVAAKLKSGRGERLERLVKANVRQR
jgi:hypothetical protein